jgi:DNA-binding transcriptional LysR family regulator
MDQRDLRDARTALDAVTTTARRARHAGQPEPGLRLALKADYDGGLLPQVLAAYQSEAAALPVELVLGGRGEQEPTLRDGRADIALLPQPFDDRSLDVEPLLAEPRLLAIAATDPLAAHTCLHLADLTGRVLPDGLPVDGEALPRDDDRQPAAHPLVTTAPPRRLDLAQIFNLIELGGIVWFPPASIARRNPRPGIAYRTVSDHSPLNLALAWPGLAPGIPVPGRRRLRPHGLSHRLHCLSPRPDDRPHYVITGPDRRCPCLIPDSWRSRRRPPCWPARLDLRRC